MNEWESSDIEIFQHSGRGISLFMTSRNYNILQDFISSVIDN
jgi:hypothetical protein